MIAKIYRAAIIYRDYILINTASAKMDFCDHAFLVGKFSEARMFRDTFLTFLPATPVFSALRVKAGVEVKSQCHDIITQSNNTLKQLVMVTQMLEL